MRAHDLAPLAVVQELFGFMAAICEDAGDLAMQGQADDDVEQIKSIANRMREAGHRLIVLSEAVTTICDR